MTSVLSLTSPAGYALQVSDRQLSVGERIVDEAANKSVIVRFTDGVMSFAYTGPAWTATKPTDHWLAETLYGRPFEDAAWIMRVPQPPDAGDTAAALHRLTQALADRPRWRTDGPAIVACGVRWRTRGSRLWPAIYTIRFSRSRAAFAIESAVPRADAPDLWVLSSEGAAELEDPTQVLRRIDAEARLESAERLLIDEMRGLAKRAPAWIGSHLMTVRIPVAKPRQITPSVGFAPRAETDRPIYRPLGEAESVGSYTPWIVAPGWASAPSMVTGIKDVTLGGFKVLLRDVPQPVPEDLGGGMKRVRLGGQVQRRRGWPRNVPIRPPPLTNGSEE